MRDQHEDAGEEGDGEGCEGNLSFAGGEFFEVEVADSEESEEGDGDVEEVFGAAIGPVPLGGFFGDVHGRRLDHEDAEAKQAQDADGEDVLETETVDGRLEHPQAVIGRMRGLALVFVKRT